jgi:hypothetical protein
VRSLTEIAGSEDNPIVEMLNERSGMWDVTPERVALLRDSRDRLSESNMEVADLMLEIAKSEVIWVCKGEYYSVLKEMQILSASPSDDEIQQTLDLVIASSKQDRVDHREWVKKTISLLQRLIDQ